MSDPGWCGKHNYRSQTTDAVCPRCKQERESADEIERLLKLVAPLCTDHAGILGDGCVGCYIEELEDHYKRYPPDYIDRLQQEIDEWQCGMRHIITDAQIDAAWERMNRLRNSENNAEHFMGRGIEGSLKQDFGIVRCEECGGGEKTILEKDNSYTGFKTITCPDCDGHGWVKKGEGNGVDND